MKTAEYLEKLSPYQPVVPPEVLAARLGRPTETIVKLDANENPYGMSPRARAALASLGNGHVYPDPESRDLRAGLAKFTGVPAENLMAGAGADELIDLLLRVILNPEDRVLSCPPTFGMYRFDTFLNRGQMVEVPRKVDFSLDLDGIRRAVEMASPRVLFLASPNNPDGRRLTDEELNAILALPLLVVIDEAYVEFTGGNLGAEFSLIRKVSQVQNLVVLRTMSKWAGLAGLRVGYGAFPTVLLPVLWKAKQPYNVNAAASTAALATLEDLEERKQKVEKITGERSRLVNRLASIPFLQVYPSEANFMLCRVEGMAALNLRKALEEEGILVRYYNSPGLSDCLRISVGTPQSTDRLTAVLLAQVKDPSLRSQIRGAWATEPGDKDSPVQPVDVEGRSASVERRTRETVVKVSLNLNGSGERQISTGIAFFDHMLEQLATHGGFDLKINALGDLEVDPHHTIEDVALSLGDAFDQALDERRGIRRCGWALFPLDEALAEVVVDFSGRGYTVFQAGWNSAQTGGVSNSLWEHFFNSFSQRAGCTLHAAVRYGRDDHHQVEALFKALSRALAAAVELDPNRSQQVLSSKGTVKV